MKPVALYTGFKTCRDEKKLRLKSDIFMLELEILAELTPAPSSLTGCSLLAGVLENLVKEI
jgi:hypothetical protein